MKDKRVSNLVPDNNSVWLMYSAGESDPYFKKFITNVTIVPAVSITNKEKTFLLVHSLDSCNLNEFEGQVIVYDEDSSLSISINDVLSSLGYPQDIYLNYSDKLDIATDVLGHGIYSFLCCNIEELYNKSGHKVNFKSADSMIYALTDRKTDEDLKYMRIAAKRALQILEDAFSVLKTGITEKQMLSLVHSIFYKKPDYFSKYNIINEGFSWEKEVCPIVLVGPNLKKGGHSIASDTVFEKGYTIYFDFGVKIELSDGRKYSSDIQRMGYALKDGETDAPYEVKKVFNTLVEAVELGINSCTPDKKGYEVDNIVRNYITSKGFADYNHSTGHPVGETAHSPGTSIAPLGRKRSELYLQENGVYTIEPRIQISNGGSIEEMVQVTRTGGKTLCLPQKSLYLI